MGEGEEKEREIGFWLCVTKFIVLFVKYLCGMSGLEGVKSRFYIPSLLNLIFFVIDIMIPNNHNYYKINKNYHYFYEIIKFVLMQ